MEKVILFYLERPDIKISIRIYFNEKEQLYFDGYDIGKSVEEAWGDSDYEYVPVVGGVFRLGGIGRTAGDVCLCRYCADGGWRLLGCDGAGKRRGA